MAVKKKILIANDLLKGGGVEKLMYDLVWNWYEKFDITIWADHYEKGAESLYPSNIKFIYEFVKKEYQDNLAEKVYNKAQKKAHKIWLQNYIKREKFDIAIAMKDGWTIKKIAELDIPVKYAWIHTDYTSNYYTYGIFKGPENELEYMKKFKKIICVADKIRESIIEVIGDPGNMVVRYNPIDVDKIRKKAKEPLVDVESVPVEGIPRFVTVGRLNHQKGYSLLLEACHMLEQDGYQFEVWVIGGKEPWGDEAYRLSQTQKRLKVQNVKFLGGRKNPYKYIKAADWFLSSSIFEGYSLVSQEAAILDIPLLLTDCSGVRELLGDNEYGMIMEISVKGIYQGMKKVIEHPELRSYYEGRIQERKHIINFYQRIKDIEELIGENC